MKKITDTHRVCLDCQKRRPIRHFREKDGNLYRRCKPCRRSRWSLKAKTTEPYLARIIHQRTAAGKATPLWSNAKNRARRYNIPFTISREDILIPTHCPLLGIELIFDNRKCLPSSPTLDCIIPALGYVSGNVWVISHRANTIKSDATILELEMIAHNLRRAHFTPNPKH